MKDGGSAIMAMGKAKGKYRIQNAILDALNSPLLNNSDIEKAEKLLYIIYSSKDSPILIDELSELDAFMEELDTNIEVIWGLYDDDSLGEYVKITIIATGFNNENRTLVTDNEELKLNSVIEQYYKPTNPIAKEAATQSSIINQEEVEAQEKDEIHIDNQSAIVPPLKERLLSRLGNMLNKLMEDE